MTCRLIAALVALGFWCGPGVHSMLAQSHPSPSKLVQLLQSKKTTNNARDELLRLGKSDPEVQKYLAAHLPRLIESGPSTADCQENTCETWLNAVKLAGQLKIAKAVPALAQWISWRERGAPLGLSSEAMLVFYPAATALWEIGNPAVPAVQHVLESDQRPRFRRIDERVLCIINTPESKAALRDFLPRESDPDLQAQIKRCLGEPPTVPD
jgi:hypothetical protein